MPHSLRVKIKGLRYKGIITDKDCDRLCKALDNENVLEQIRTEIEQLTTYEDIWLEYKGHTKTICKSEVLEIIDKHMGRK